MKTKSEKIKVVYLPFDNQGYLIKTPKGYPDFIFMKGKQKGCK